MSLKYERIKRTDLALPAPLRWLTRAFSSITLAVTLLACIALYGMIASVPFPMMLKGAMYGLIIVGTVGMAVLAGYRLLTGEDARRPGSVGLPVRLTLALVLLTGSIIVAIRACLATYHWADADPWFRLHAATVIYRLPYFEMTELEFYAWWPMKLLLGLFVLNLVWATVRRIEFKFANIGVLTVHTGIVTIAVGSIFYGSNKIEGDTILFRKDLGGTPVRHFYDATRPAVYFMVGNATRMFRLDTDPKLPRYNDYPLGTLNIRLDQRPEFQEIFGPRLRASIPGFVSYGVLHDVWVDADQDGAVPPDNDAPNPAIEIQSGTATSLDGRSSRILVAQVPSDRVLDLPAWTVEYLVAPTKQRLDDLQARFDGEHGLVVEVPAKHFRQVYAIAPGKTIQVGDTGYTLTIQDIGDYGMPFVTPGYRGATDTRALVQVSDGKQTFRRIVMFRYPERTQDFVPVPNDPNVGPMGKRRDPDPAIRLTYIDASKLQYHIIADSPESTTYHLLVRLPAGDPFLVPLAEDKFPLPTMSNRELWLHIARHFLHAVRTTQPVITPKAQRNPKDEGTFVDALLPVQLEADVPGPDGKLHTWKKIVWLPHMRYPMFPDDVHHPVTVDIPTLGPVSLVFSRVRYDLPFLLTLDDFEMDPYPGTQIPRDFVSHLSIQTPRSSADRNLFETGETRLNNPLVYHGIKLSQTGWDPGDSNDPANNDRNAEGKFINQQRFTILGVGNNVGIHAIFAGACLIVLGIPWAFYIKPLLVQRQKRRIQAELAARMNSLSASENVKDAASPVTTAQ